MIRQTYVEYCIFCLYKVANCQQHSSHFECQDLRRYGTIWVGNFALVLHLQSVQPACNNQEFAMMLFVNTIWKIRNRKLDTPQDCQWSWILWKYLSAKILDYFEDNLERMGISLRARQNFIYLEYSVLYNWPGVTGPFAIYKGIHLVCTGLPCQHLLNLKTVWMLHGHAKTAWVDCTFG